MGFTIGIIVGLLSLIFLFLINKFNFSLARKLKEKRLPFSTKVLFAFLNGFIIFIIFTPRITFVSQKIIIIVVSLILIVALNIKIPAPKHEDSENTEK